MRTATRDMARNFKPGTYLHSFFSEKKIPYKVFKVTDSQGLTHDIPNEVVVEAIAQTRGSERKKIEDTLRKLDFRNGDVNHFLAHLAKGLAESYGGSMRFASSMKSAYYTVFLDPGPGEWQHPTKVLQRGAFDTEREAHAWAKKQIPDVKYRVKEIKDVLPVKAASMGSFAKNIVRWLDNDPAAIAGYLHRILVDWEWGYGNIAEDFGRLTRSLHGGKLPVPSKKLLAHAWRHISTGSPEEEVHQVADMVEAVLTEAGERGMASRAKDLILKRMLGLTQKVARLVATLPPDSEGRKKLLAAVKEAADPSVDREIKAFAKEIQDMVDKRDKKDFAVLWESAMEKGWDRYTLIGIDWGRKYARIWRGQPDKTDRSVHCFVNRENGDILKAASWKKPAKHARGNVMDRSGRMRSVGPYGANYLRG